MVHYRNRAHAGEVLAGHLQKFAGRPNLSLIALPRGGIAVAAEIARHFCLPFAVLPVRKIGAPGHEEYALGAITSGSFVLDQSLADQLKVSAPQLEEIMQREKNELDRRASLYGNHFSTADVTGRLAIVIDDGMATGSTMKAAVRSLREKKPEELIVAVPVSSRTACDQLLREAEDVICPHIPSPFRSVSDWYGEFEEVTDDEVRRLIESGAAFGS